MCVENIFYKSKKLQMKFLLGKSNIAPRDARENEKQLKQAGAIDRFIRYDEGFRFLSSIF